VSEEQSMKLHLGCGKRYIPGFIHVDLSDYPHIDYRHDVTDLSIFPDEYADLLYACHILEYFDRRKVESVLADWRRVLKKGGVLRISVPDFEALVKLYHRTHDLYKILGPLYGRWEVSKGFVIYHHTVYDFDSLARLLVSVGFKNPYRYDWRRTEHKDYDDFSQAYYPHMDKENGLLISLNVEATKG